MKPMPALVVGLVLAALAAPVCAQGWHGGRGGGHEGGRGGGGGGEPRGFPQGGEQRGPPQGQPFRGPPQGQPFRGPPQPQPFRGPPPGVGWEGDSLGAGWAPQQDEVRQGVRQRRFVPLGQAIDSIRRRAPGRELDAGLEQWGGRPAYRVRWAGPGGRRIDYMVDAESGAILSVDGGR
jgi:Peptidase propeptide and YPEB domain